MTAYTVWCAYGATGEGQTHMIWYGFCEGDHESDALSEFRTHFGDWYAQGAQVVKGFCFDNASARMLVSEAAKRFLTDPEGNKSFHAQLHVNYS